jgi:hypothetical protein
MAGKKRIFCLLVLAFVSLGLLSACYHHDRGLHRGHYKHIDKGPGRR